MGFLPLGSLPFSQVQRADGHLVRCSAQPGKEPKEQRPALPRTAFSPGELWRGRRSQPRPATATQGLPGFLPFLSSGLLEPLESGELFPNPRGGSTSLHWMDEHQCPPPLPVPWAPGDRALSGRTRLRTQSKDVSVHVSQKTDSRGYAG